MSRPILDAVSEEKKRLFTIPLTLDEIVGFHVAADILGTRNPTNLAYQYIRNQIDEAKQKNAKEFDRLFPIRREKVLKRSRERKKQARRATKSQPPSANVININKAQRSKLVPCLWDGKPSQAGICEDCKVELDKPKITREKLDDLPYGAIELDASGTILEYNKAESEMSRVSHGNAMRKNFFTRIAPCADVQDFHERYDNFLKGNKPSKEFQFTYRFKHGTVHVLITFLRLDARRALVVTKKVEEDIKQGRRDL